jgi:hypothetical protein
VTFENTYPEDCTPIPQRTAPGMEPRYLAEAWWLIGDHHFNEVDPAGGPFNLNHAEAAYRRALRFKKPPVYGVAMYKLAWTYFKQQRYEAAVSGGGRARGRHGWRVRLQAGRRLRSSDPQV